ncbi:DUF6651 domain-containing protein, partial [Acinetobacter baumannii]
MPLWMQLLMNGGLLRQEANGEGSDLGGGSGGEGGEGDEKKEPTEPTKKDSEADDESKNKPTDKEAELLKEVMKKKAEAQKVKQELEELKARYIDIDPEIARKAINEQKEKETKELEAKGDFERLKARMAEEHAKEVNALKAKIAELEGANASKSQMINDLTVGAQFNQSQYIKQDLIYTPTKLRALYGNHFEIEDGKVVGYDKPRGAAERTKIVDSHGNPVNFDKALEKIVSMDPDA